MSKATKYLKKAMSGMPTKELDGIDLDKEYEKIVKKESTLPSQLRAIIVHKVNAQRNSLMGTPSDQPQSAEIIPEEGNFNEDSNISSN